jgi:hypothetical protein
LIRADVRGGVELFPSYASTLHERVHSAVRLRKPWRAKSPIAAEPSIRDWPYIDFNILILQAYSLLPEEKFPDKYFRRLP